MSTPIVEQKKLLDTRRRIRNEIDRIRTSRNTGQGHQEKNGSGSDKNWIRHKIWMIDLEIRIKRSGSGCLDKNRIRPFQ